jgi:hypothetical protein
MTLEVITAAHQKKAPAETDAARRELVSRIASSVTFEKSPRLRSFFLHVCRCALEDKPEEATEQQIGIHVYGRPAGYNPNEDNIVRSQARVLRMKLEHHFANEGKHESIVINIPKGQYLPIFENRLVESPRQFDAVPAQIEKRRPYLRWMLSGAAILLSLVLVWIGMHSFRSKSISPHLSSVPATARSAAPVPESSATSINQPAGAGPGSGEIRIAAGHSGNPYVDVWGHRWEADRFFKGGVVQPGPAHFFPPTADGGLFRTMREAVSADLMGPEDQRAFQYDIPLLPGVYELRLYFADPLRQPDENQKEDAQNLRHIDVELNGHPLLADLDPIADAGSGAIDIRAFKDVQPAQDGKLHLEFRSRWGHPAFVSGIELTPGSPGRLNPIRISTRQSGFTDSQGIHWSGDRFFLDGRTWTQPQPPGTPRIPALYETERHGNFSYAIPVPPGSYTVRLHFLESFFSPLTSEAYCHGVGCRVFDVTCNGVLLLQDFDIFQTAGGAFRPVVREFHGLHPDGQGKLLISFSPKVNYAEVRAIEVLDETK